MNTKNPDEIVKMTEGGKLLGQILTQLLNHVKVGATPLEIDKWARTLIAEVGGSPSFMTVRGYKWATCISVNDGVVHGIPTTLPFKSADLVSIDVGLLYKGYHTDASWTVFLPPNPPNAQYSNNVEKFLNVGKEALKKAIAQAKPGNRVGHISAAIQTTVEKHGYAVVKGLVGHAIGKTLHEYPQIPGVVTKSIETTPLLYENMTLAIEVIYAMGLGEIVHANDDGWSLVTADGSLAGLFEATVVISGKGPIILTRSEI